MGKKKVLGLLRQIKYFSWGAGFLCLIFAAVGYLFPAMTDYFTGAEGSLEVKREVIIYTASRIFAVVVVIHVFSSLAVRIVGQEEKERTK